MDKGGFSLNELDEIAGRFPPLKGEAVDLWKTKTDPKPKRPILVPYSLDYGSPLLIQILTEQLNLGAADLKQLVHLHPVVLSYNPDRVKQVLQFFQKNFSFTKTEMCKVILKDPQILNSDPDTALQRMTSYLIEDIKLEKNALKKVVFQQPSLLRRRPLLPLITYLTDELEMTPSNVTYLITKAPALFSLSLEENIKPTLQFLRSELGFTHKQRLVWMVLRAPMLLYADTVPRIASFKSYMNAKAGLSSQEVRAMLASQPAILTRKLSSMDACIDFLTEELGADHKLLASILKTVPAIVSCSIENKLRPTSTYFLKDIGISGESFRQMLSFKPQLLTYSLEDNLKPKVQFFMKLKGVNIQFLRSLFIKHPAILGYSLNGRILPRINKLQESGIEASKDHLLAACVYTDEKFERFLNNLT